MADIGRRHVGQYHREEKGRHPHSAPARQNPAVFFQCGESPVPVAQDNADAEMVFSGHVQAGRFNRRQTGGHCQLGKPCHPAGIAGRNVLYRVEIANFP